MHVKRSAQHRRPRTSRRAALTGATLVAMAAAALAATAPSTLAVLTDATTVAENTVSTDTVQPPSALTVERAPGEPAAAPVLTWAPSTSDFATGYAIYAATSEGGPYTQIGTVDGRTTTTFTDPEPSRIRSTYYVVSTLAYNWLSGKTSESVGASQTYSSAVLNDAPIGYWRLNDPANSGTLADSSGNDLTATITNTITTQQPSLVATDPGNKSAAMASGSDAYGEVLDAPVFHTITESTGATYEMWIKTPSTFGAAGSFRTLISKGQHDGSDSDFELNAYSFDGTRITAFLVKSTLTGDVWIPLEVMLASGSVHHIAFATGENAYGNLYVDGVLVGNNPGYDHESTPISGSPLWLGNGNEYNWSGGLDEIALYNKTLTADQVRTHYRAGLTLTQSVADSQAYSTAVSADNPTSYWPMSDSQGSAFIADLGEAGPDAKTVNQGNLTLGQASLVSTSPATSATVNGTGTSSAVADFRADYNSDAVTLEMWLKTPADLGKPTDGSTQFLGLLAKQNGSIETRDFNLYAYTKNGHTVDGFHLASVPYGNTFARLPVTLAPNTTHHLVVTASRDGFTSYYVDGVTVSQVDVFVAPKADYVMSTANIIFGRAEDNAWKGGFGQVAIYDHMLSIRQVAQHYNAASQVPQNVDAASLWTFGSVRWAPPPNDDAISGYKVYRGTSATNLSEIATVAGASRSYTDDLAAASANGVYQYWYAVAAINPNGTVTKRSAPVLAWMNQEASDARDDLDAPNGLTGEFDGDATLEFGQVHVTGYAADTDDLERPTEVEVWAVDESLPTWKIVYLGRVTTNRYSHDRAAVDSRLWTSMFDQYLPSPGSGTWTITGEVVDNSPALTSSRLPIQTHITI